MKLASVILIALAITLATLFGLSRLYDSPIMSDGPVIEPTRGRYEAGVNAEYGPYRPKKYNCQDAEDQARKGIEKYRSCTAAAQCQAVHNPYLWGFAINKTHARKIDEIILELEKKCGRRVFSPPKFGIKLACENNHCVVNAITSADKYHELTKESQANFQSDLQKDAP